jgi:hypothetical protein
VNYPIGGNCEYRREGISQMKEKAEKEKYLKERRRRSRRKKKLGGGGTR